MSLGIATIFLTYFVGINSAWLHAWTVAALTGGIALIIFIVVLDNRPCGNLRLGPDAFELVLQTIE